MFSTFPISRFSAFRLLPAAEWQARAAAHEQRVRAWTDPHQARVARGEKHPVYDFLFTYYAFRPAWLRRWHPGPDVALAGEPAREFLRWPEYRELALDPASEAGTPGPDSPSGLSHPPVSASGSGFRPPASGFSSSTADPDPTPAPSPSLASVSGLWPPASGPSGIAIDPATLPAHRREFVAWLRGLLAAMQTRPAFFGCFGLHEWAMVYRQTPDEIRHNAYPLRFAPDDLARIVESASVTCTHFDAFRFFTAPARPLNKLQPTRPDTAQLEQRGCLHANMDLYKWSFKLAPFTPSELMADCFELARDIREIDMRASPYDLRALGFAPIPIETPAGRAEYESHQRQFATRGDPLRTRLIALCDRLLQN